MTNNNQGAPTVSNPQQEVLAVMIEALAKESARMGPIQIMETASGSFDVVLRLDGTYTDRADAEASAEFLTGALLDAARPYIAPLAASRTPGAGIGDLLIAMNEQVQP